MISTIPPPFILSNEPPALVESIAESIPDLIARLAYEQNIPVSDALAVAYCESHLRQYDDSQILRGVVNPKDVGLFQINEDYHLKKSIELGFDIYTTVGNIKYALYLMKNNGLAPWHASESCWLSYDRPIMIQTRLSLTGS